MFFWNSCFFGDPMDVGNLIFGSSAIALISHTSKVMLKIFQARRQQYVDRELPDVQAGFRKGRGTRDQIANIIKKAREFQKNIYFCFIDYVKAFDCVDHNKLWEILRDGRIVWMFLKKLKIELPYDPAILLLGIYPEKIIIQKDT